MKRAAIAVLLIAAALRFYDLGKPPLFFDESIHSVFANAVLKGSYKYDPAYHGPLLFYTVAPVLALLGENEFTLRLVPATLGVAFVASLLLYRRYIGNKAAVAALFVALSPVIVNYSRFYRGDVYQLLFTSLAVYFILRYLEANRNWRELKVDRSTLHLTASAIFLALFAATKETFYVFAALLAIYLVIDAHRFRISDLLISLAAFSLVYLTFYTNFWTHTEPLTNFSQFPAVRAIEYWKYQHEIARIAGPAYYHLEILVLYDLPALLLAAVAIKRWSLGEKDDFTSMFVFLFFANLLFYSYMQEKVPWLAVHIEFPMFVLAAKVADGKKAAITALFLLYGCVALNIVNPVNPAEPALYMPTQYDVREITKNFDEGSKIYVFTTVGEYWPLAWYLRGYTVYYYTSGVEGVGYSSADVIIANETNAAKIKLDWQRETMVVRCWSFWTQPEISKIPEFLALRRPFAEVYCMNFTVFFRTR
ncbi:MAG: flippase activity-associated protein Agl23 [Archaeoglobaceae archaeon]